MWGGPGRFRKPCVFQLIAGDHINLTLLSLLCPDTSVAVLLEYTTVVTRWRDIETRIWDTLELLPLAVLRLIFNQCAVTTTSLFVPLDQVWSRPQR